MIFFQTGLGKILIWQNSLERESPTLNQHYMEKLIVGIKFL